MLAYPTLGQPIPDLRDQEERKHEEKPTTDYQKEESVC